MTISLSQWRLHAASWLLTVAAVSPCMGQVEDVIATAQKLPPAQWPPSLRENFDSAVQWRITQIKLMHDNLRESRDRIRADLKELATAIEFEEEALPRELRFSDKEGRSQLATHIVQSMFDTQLDLAVNQEMLVRLEESQPQRDEERGLQRELDLRAAERELALALGEAEITAAQGERGISTRLELERAKATAEIAELKVQSARAALAVVDKEYEGAKAKRLTELRLQQKPLQAKLESVEAFLDTIKNSDKQLKKIEQYRREQELVMRDLAWVAGELGPLSLELLELENLAKLVKEKASQETPAKDGKVGSPGN